MQTMTPEQFKDLITQGTSESLKEFAGGMDDLKARMEKMEQSVDVNALRAMFGPEPKKKVRAKGVIGAFVQYIANGKNGLDGAERLAKEMGDEDMLAHIANSRKASEKMRQKQVLAGDLSSAGSLVPPDMSAEFIELLRGASVFMSAGPRILPMPNGNLQIARGKTGSSGGWVGETKNNPATDLTTDLLKLSAKKAFALIPVSNDLLRFTSQQAQQIIEEDLVNDLSEVLDIAFLRGDGTEFQPKGVRFAALAANVVASVGDALQNIVTDLSTAINRVESADVRLRSPAWFLSPKHAWGIFRALDANDQLSFLANEMTARGTLLGWPMHKTTHIPDNLNTNESEILFVEMTDAIVGETEMLEVESMPGAAYVDSANTVRASFSQDVTPIRALTMVDFALRHPESASVITAVTYGN